MRIATAPVNWNSPDVPEYRAWLPYAQMMDEFVEAVAAFGAGPDRLLERVECEVGAQRPRGLPADDHPRVLSDAAVAAGLSAVRCQSGYGFLSGEL